MWSTFLSIEKIIYFGGIIEVCENIFVGIMAGF